VIIAGKHMATLHHGLCRIGLPVSFVDRFTLAILNFIYWKRGWK
jgi:hypothetical protein